MVGRYDAKGPEAESEPGSRGRVLRNRVGITSVREIERRESEALLAATQATIDETRSAFHRGGHPTDASTVAGRNLCVGR
jgi:hypothetical protein